MIDNPNFAEWMADFDAWKRAFDNDPLSRQQNGVTGWWFRVSAARLRSLVIAGLTVVGVLLVPGMAWAGSSVYITDQGNNSGAIPLVESDAVGAGGALMPSSAQQAGDLPDAVAVTPDGQNAYVVDYGADTVSQYTVFADGSLNPKFPAAVATGSFPAAIAVSPDGKSVYVANSDQTGTVSQYDIGAGGVLSPKTPATVVSGSNPLGIAISADGKSVYVANSYDGTVSQYDVGAGGVLSPKTPAIVTAGTGPEAVAVTPDGSSVYVLNRGGSVSEYDVGAGGVLSPKNPATVATGAFPAAIAVSPDGRSVYVTDENNTGPGDISQYDIGAGGALAAKTPATVATGTGPNGITVSPDGKSVYVTNNGDNAVSQYDVGAGGALAPKSPATVATQPGPFGIVASPDQGPVAQFGFAAQPAGGATTFDGSTSYDADGSVTRYDWSFGDGTTAADAGPKPSHTYAAAGTYTVTLTVTDNAGCSTAFVYTGQTASCVGTPAAAMTRTVTVPPAGSPPPPPSPPPPAPPHAAFTFSPSGPICAPETVTFDPSASTPGSAPIIYYQWDFSSPDVDNAFGHYYYFAWHAFGWSGAQLWEPGPAEWARTYPADTFEYSYAPLSSSTFSNSGSIDDPYDQEIIASGEFGEAILGRTVTLTVTNADGLSSSATATLAAVQPSFRFFAASGPLSPAQCLRDRKLAPPGTFPKKQSFPVKLASGATYVPLNCTTAVFCVGSLTVAAATRAGYATAAAARRARLPVLGTQRYAILPRHHATIKIALNKRGRALARRHGLLRLRITITPFPIAGQTEKPVSRVLTVRRARRSVRR